MIFSGRRATNTGTLSTTEASGQRIERKDRVHPFRKYFEELQPGDSLLTPRRTLTETMSRLISNQPQG
jgi:hypothetical protein